MKKRTNSQIDPNDPFIQTRALFHGAPNSEFHITKIDRQRKVKFAAPEKDSPKTCRLKQDSRMPSEKEKVTTCADTDPKTSEFAFFKKLKKDANLRFRPRPLQKDACLSPKKPESGDYSRERTNDHNDVRVGNEGYMYNSSRIVKDVSTVKTDSFLSPSASGGAWNKSDLYSIRSIPKSSQGCGDTFKPQGNQYMHGEIFSRKRQKLRQCVADAFFLDTEKLCSKRHDIVSMLLSRLFPMNIMENQSEDPNPGEVVENATRYDLLDSQEPAAQFKEHYQIPKRKLHELDSSSDFSDQLLSPVFLRSDERITPHGKFPTYHSDNFQPLYNKTAPECKLSRTPSFSASVKSDVTLGSLFNEAENVTRYDLLDSRELDVQFTEHHQIPRRKLLELESSSNFSDHLLSPLFLRSVELITPHTDFPTYPHKFQPQFSKIDDESKFGGTPSFFDKNDVTHGFLHNEQKHEALTLNHFMESRKLEREPNPLLLEKDYDCTTDEINLPITKYTKPDMASALSILGHGEEQILNKTLDEYHFSPSSLLLDKPRDFNSILNSGLLRYQEFRFGKYVYQDSEDMDRIFNHTALSLSHKKRYFKLSENCKDDISCVQDSLYLSPYQHWVGRTVSNHYHHRPDTEAWLQSSLDECQRCLSLTSPHWNYQSSDSRTLQLPQRESMSSLLCTNDNYQPEMDGGNHGEALYHFREGLIEIYNSSFLRLSMQRDNGCPFPLDDNDYINEQEQTHKMLL